MQARPDLSGGCALQIPTPGRGWPCGICLLTCESSSTHWALRVSCGRCTEGTRVFISWDVGPWNRSTGSAVTSGET